MNLLVKSHNSRMNLRVYIIKNKELIENEYKILIPQRILNMSGVAFDAWIEVHASRILMAKDVKQCLELKEMVKEYLLLDIEVENYVSQ